MPNEFTDRRTPGTPEAMNAEITGAQDEQRGGHLPFRVVGYNPQTNEAGELVLYATRSRLDIKPVTVLINAAILKKLAALYCVVEADLQLEAQGIRLTEGPGSNGERPREMPGAVDLLRGGAGGLGG